MTSKVHARHKFADFLNETIAKTSAAIVTKCILISGVLVAIWFCFNVLKTMKLRNSGKHVKGGVFLQKYFDNDLYYIVDSSSLDSPDGLVEGAVLEIGWNRDCLLIKRIPTDSLENKKYCLIILNNMTILYSEKPFTLTSDPHISIYMNSASAVWNDLK